MQALSDLELDHAILISISSYDPRRRTYELDDKVYKVVLKEGEGTGPERAQDLRGEYEILRKCDGIKGIPKPIGWRASSLADCLVLEKIRGLPVSEIDLSLVEFLGTIIKTSAILWKLGRKGISHNDVKARNILRTEQKSVSLIDFDQATQRTLVLSLLQSILGLSIGDQRVHGSYFSLVKNHYMKQCRKISMTRIGKILRRMRDTSPPMPTLPTRADDTLRLLYRAWTIARTSNASSPDRNIAYYSYVEQGIAFPGERPWLERWNVLKDITDYRNKRILEIGCNMGLLSIWILKEKGGAAALGVDADANILESAKLVAAARGVSFDVAQIDLDSNRNWERRLEQYNPDIVFALNVLNWVRQKQRLLEFLGQFNEVIFEGHDKLSNEVNRFTRLGFENIKMVAVSDRNRPVIYCRK